MEKLNYLRQDKKIPGKESFVTYVDFQVKDGTADMWLYDIFPGVQLNIINLRKKWKGICSQVPFIVLKYRQGCI